MKRSALAVLFFLAVTAALAVVPRSVEPLNPATLPPLPVNLAKPDALVLTQSLTQLPRDVLTVPLLKELLTEDFIFYYEQNEGRLGLQGTLRRIAYEHELTIGDELMAYIMDKPAEVALWKGRDGRLGHYLISMRRDGLTKLLELVSKAAVDDTQLRWIGDAALPNSEQVSVFQLDYAHNRSLYFAGYGDRLVIFSEPRMVLSANEGESRTKQLAALFGLTDGSYLYGQRFPSANLSAKHSVMVSTEYLSFGYQAFFPSVQAMRFDYAAQGWSTSALVMGGSEEGLRSQFDTASLWRVVPTAPSLCVALPVDIRRVVPLLQGLGKGPATSGRDLPLVVESPVAVCWYPESALHAPLIVFKAQESKALRDYLKAVFETTIGGRETRGDDSVQRRFDVVESRRNSATIWRRAVSSAYGLRDGELNGESAGNQDESALPSGRYFNVTMAYARGYVLFSPNEELVDNGLAVLERRYPALGDSLRGGEEVGAVIVPASFSRLMEEAVLETLSADDEPLFRETASRRLVPILHNVSKYPAYTMSMPQPPKWGLVWKPLKWETLAN